MSHLSHVTHMIEVFCHTYPIRWYFGRVVHESKALEGDAAQPLIFPTGIYTGEIRAVVGGGGRGGLGRAGVGVGQVYVCVPNIMFVFLCKIVQRSLFWGCEWPF